MSLIRSLVRGGVLGAKHQISHAPEEKQGEALLFMFSFFLIVVIAYIVYNRYKRILMRKSTNDRSQTEQYFNIDIWKEKMKRPKDYGRLFWVDGHVGQKTFLLYCIAMFFLTTSLSIILPTELFVLSILPIGYFMMCLYVKRIHDLGFSGYWFFMYLLLYVNMESTFSYIFLSVILTLPLFIFKTSKKIYECRKKVTEATGKIGRTKTLRFIIFILLLYVLITLALILNDYHK